MLHMICISVKEAKKAGAPYHVAFAIENNKVICWGANMPMVHAEENVIKKLYYLQTKHKIKWEKITVIVVRFRMNETTEQLDFKMSKPCKHCSIALRNTQIKNICWSNDYGNFNACRVCNLQSTHLSRRHRE